MKNKKYKKLIINLPTSIPKISLIHSPIKLTDNDVLVLNDTKVMPSRIYG